MHNDHPSGEIDEPVLDDSFKLLTDEHIEIFKRDGVVVIPNVISPEMVATVQRSLHAHLAEFGVDHGDLASTGHNLRHLSSTGGAGGILDIFYAPWRMKLAENERIFHAVRQLWASTYCCSDCTDFQHPYGDLNWRNGYMYLNRVCYRVPDRISKQHAARKSRPLQRSLTPHLDCCPNSLYNSGKEIPRWRPIQSFIALTSNHEASMGGFEAVVGFHREFKTYFADRQRENNLKSAVCLGDFSPLTTSYDKVVIDRFEHIAYEAGSLVLWDWRIPHANAYHHYGEMPREVVYTEFLPDVELNRRYAEEQLTRYKARQLPADHWQSPASKNENATTYSFHHFSALGARLIGLYPWKTTEEEVY